MSIRTPFTEGFISPSPNELKALKVDRTLSNSNSLGQAGKEAVVVAVITEDPAAGPADFTSAGMSVITRRFNPSSAPFGYIVKIEERAPINAVTPSQIQKLIKIRYLKF